jgi:hypothetical protein
MREIKFRQPIMLRGKFLHWHYWGFMSEGNFTSPDHSWVGGEPSQQFTGLLDKNGVEIYEGDIVEMRLRENIGTFNVPDDVIANNGYTGREDVYSGDVVFDKSGFFGINDKESGVINFMPGEDTIIEIIGNLYEKPI